MADLERAYPDNATGRYYVDPACIDCDLCRKTALACFDRNESGGYSYVRVQPTTPEEEALCAQALAECPVNAIGDDGPADGEDAPVDGRESK